MTSINRCDNIGERKETNKKRKEVMQMSTDNIIKLENGEYLANFHGKYQPNLTFLFHEKYFSTKSEKYRTTDKDAEKCLRHIHENFRVIREWQEEIEISEWSHPLGKILHNCIEWVDDKNINLRNFAIKGQYEHNLNVHIDGSLSEIIYGEFFVSKKGKNCFRVSEAGKHQLLVIDWGGCFNKSRGCTGDDISDKLYYRRASSNGGGSGFEYIVTERGYIQKHSAEEFEV